MNWQEIVVEIVTTPWVVGAAAVGGLLKTVGLAGVWSFLTALAGQWFGPLAIGAGWIAPNIDVVPTNVVMGLTVGAAMVVFIAKVNSTVDWMRRKYR